MALGLTQPPAEISTSVPTGGNGDLCAGLESLPPSCLEILSASAFWGPKCLSRPIQE